MDAARAFMAQRKDVLPVAVIAYNRDITVLTDFTRDCGRAVRGYRKGADDGRGHPHLRRPHRSSAPGREGRLRPHDGRAALRRASSFCPGHARGDRRGSQRCQRTRHLGRSAVARVRRRDAADRREADRRNVCRERDAGAARADLHHDRAAALERVRRQLPLAPSAECESDGYGGRSWPRRGDRELHDARPRLLTAGHVRSELRRRHHHLCRGS